MPILLQKLLPRSKSRPLVVEVCLEHHQLQALLFLVVDRLLPSVVDLKINRSIRLSQDLINKALGKALLQIAPSGVLKVDLLVLEINRFRKLDLELLVNRRREHLGGPRYLAVHRVASVLLRLLVVILRLSGLLPCLDLLVKSLEILIRIQARLVIQLPNRIRLLLIWRRRVLWDLARWHNSRPLINPLYHFQVDRLHFQRGVNKIIDTLY